MSNYFFQGIFNIKIQLLEKKKNALSVLFINYKDC